MDGRRVAPVLGIVGCVAVLLGLAVPYLLLDATAVGVYYDAGPVTPLAAGLFGAISVIVFAAGRQGRTDPALAAGVALVFGVVVAAISIAWALSVQRSLVFSLTNNANFEYHRFALAAVSVLVPIAGAWYTRALGLV